MTTTRPLVLATLAVLAAASPGAAVDAASYDSKAISVALCEPYAPDTTVAEIQLTQTGIYNPGTSIEKVICALPRDRESAYEGDALTLGIYYRVLGAAPGRVTCTLFVGSSTMHSDAVATTTGSGALVSGGTRDNFVLSIGTQPGPYGSVPNTLICAISPKTSLGGIYFLETGLSDYVEPPA